MEELAPASGKQAGQIMGYTEYPETHTAGNVQLLNLDEVRAMLSANQTNDFGLQVAHDGRVWVCINGMALIRFKPDRK